MIPRNKEMRFEIINMCQYDCIICMKNSQTREKKFMNFFAFKHYLDKILFETKQYDSVSFAGIGEPLLNGDIYQMVEYASSKGLKTLIVTNGDFLTKERFLRLQDAGLTSIRVSFHGGDIDGYTNLHRVEKEKFYKVQGQLDEIFEVKDRTKVLLTFVVVKGVNDNCIEDWKKMWNGRADLMEIWRAHNWVYGLKNRIVQREKMNTCGRIENGPLQVQVDGTVNACCFDWDGKLIFGDLNEHSLKQIFSSCSYKAILKRHQSGDFEHSGLICKECDQRNADKKEALIYSSKYRDVRERVKMTSTCYDKVIA